MLKKLRIALIYSDLVAKTLNANHHMHNLYANFVNILGFYKKFSINLVNEKRDSSFDVIIFLILSQ